MGRRKGWDKERSQKGARRDRGRECGPRDRRMRMEVEVRDMARRVDWEVTENGKGSTREVSRGVLVEGKA